MSSSRNQLIELIDHDYIPDESIPVALELLKIIPDNQSWATFINHLLLWVGSLCLAFAGMFFIAYNWNEIGHMSKFAITEVILVMAIVSYWKIVENTTTEKVSLLVAVIFLGVLLALFGQTYQTGADHWQLFFYWALLMIPWAFIARFPVIWIIWVWLCNLSIILFHQITRDVPLLLISDDLQLLWILFSFNTTALICWERLSIKYTWLAQNWATRLLATTTGCIISWLVLFSIFSNITTAIWPVLFWLIWLVLMYWFYRKIKQDLFMLAGCCLSFIVIVTAFQAKHLISSESSAGSFLYLGFFITVLGSGAAIWLRKIHREFRS